MGFRKIISAKSRSPCIFSTRSKTKIEEIPTINSNLRTSQKGIL
jgi:hypothetical protein